jgi:transposase
MRTKGTAAELEVRRRIAGKLLLEGRSASEVAKIVDVSLSSAKRWRKAVLDGGIEALASKPHPGRRPYLDPRQKQRLVAILLAGPGKAGYKTDLWTCPRVAEVIARRFGVRYHVDHVWQVLHHLGWSCQKPEQRARERNEETIRRWRKYDWPRIKKGAASSS